MKYIIKEVHPEDAYYDLRDKLIGQTVMIDDPQETEFEGFVSGHVYLYAPIEMSWGDLTNIQMSYVKLEEV